MKKTQIILNFISLSLIAGVFAAMPVFAQIPPESEWKEEGVCARVRIQISQDVAITRTAFRATLEIDNAPENVSLENLKVTIEITNDEQKECNDLFGVKSPELTGIDDINGNGILAPGTSCKAVWIIVPTRDAAPDIPTQYYVGGTLSYKEGDSQMNMPLFPASITVKPDPKLVLNYFLQRVVYSDDPFTKDIIEPAEPFPLGLILHNQGKGTAHNVRIASSQPEIIENEKGLLIDFTIISTQVNTEPVTPSLTVDLGKIEPSQTSVAQWIMTSSLQGKFIKDENMVKFEHVDDLGDTRTSLIDSVSIRELLHTVRVDIPEDDKKPDFLVNDIEDANFMPDTLYKSDGSTALVNVATNTAINRQVSNTNLEVTLTADAPNGWIYIRTDDPGQEKFVLKKVVRSDGREIRMDDNVWTTHRTIRLVGQTPYRESLLHLFDYVENGNCEYTLFYENLLAVPQPPVLMFIPDRSFPEGLHFGFLVMASDPNGTTPTISAEPLPDGATFTYKGNNEWYFDWATKTGDAGKYKITFTASDGELTDFQDVTVTIYSNSDTDGDRMPDEWEKEHFNTLDRDGTGDFDGNGISDLDEYLNEIGTPEILSGYTLTVKIEPPGGGTLTLAEGVYNYPQNETVNIEAEPGPGYKFDYWKGDVENPNSPYINVTMNKAKTVTANFVPIAVFPGDIDNNGITDLNDAILASKIVCGIKTDSDIYLSADVNNDAKIGMDEAIYTLQCSGGIYTDTIEVSGMIIKDTTWNARTVKVTGNVRIADGVMLTIIPGTYIEFQGYYKLIVWGRLTAEGTAERMITFAAKDKAVGWRGIRFDNEYGDMDDNGLSKLVYCRLAYGKATEGTNVYDDAGGAVFMNNFSNVLISNCIISNNQAAGEGGAIYCRYSNPVIVNNLICNNTASGSGGGIYAVYSSPKLINNTIVHNSASAGGGICLWGDSAPEIVNTILWGNTAGDVENQVALLQKTCDPYLSYCNVQGGSAAFSGWGAGSKYDASRYLNNIDENPMFVNHSNGVGANFDGLSANWALQANSPCINKGTPDITGLPNLSETDLAGNPRINSNIIDIGAYEYQLSKP